MPREHRGEPAQCVDILVDIGQPGLDRLADIVELGARIGVPAAIFTGDAQRFGLVIMLILALADDFLDQLLARQQARSEEHTSELPSLMRIQSAVLCLKKQTQYSTSLNTSTISTR